MHKVMIMAYATQALLDDAKSGNATSPQAVSEFANKIDKVITPSLESILEALRVLEDIGLIVQKGKNRGGDTMFVLK